MVRRIYRRFPIRIVWLTCVLRSIVNGLRDDDGESFYGDRASFYSEYSVKDDSNVKLSFKEHERKSSKGSVNSFLSRKKSQQQAKGTNRPETKVCDHVYILEGRMTNRHDRSSSVRLRRLVAS